MEKIVRRLFLTGTLVVGLAVSGLCLQTYAITCTGTGVTSSTSGGITTCTGVDESGKMPNATGTSTFSITVDKVLTLSNVSGTNTINADITKVATGQISATVTSNAKYTISLKASETSLVKSGDTTNKIPASNNVAKGTNAWGVKKKAANGTNEDTYTGLTTADQVFFTSTASAPSGVASAFEVGVSVSPALPTGTYATTVTVTAAAQP